jgi:hypothetical protein
MSSDWTEVPAEFFYLQNAARKFGVHNGFVDRYNEMLDNLSTKEIEELAAVYEEIERRRHSVNLSNWIEKSGTRVAGAARSVFDLFLVFDLLGERNIAPFNARTIVYEPTEAPFDWSNLPTHLSYLIEPAQEFGVYQFEDSINRFVQKISHSHRRQLNEIQRRIRSQGHVDDIYCWLDRYPIREHREARLVAYLIEVLKAAGFPIEDEPDPTVIEAIKQRVQREIGPQE